jgi:N-acetyl sugar amidotransferase
MEAQTFRRCTRCVMDTTDPEIVFDEQGRCNHCTGALLRLGKQLLADDARAEALNRLVETARAEGRGKPYDCIIGVSGGVDSCYTAIRTKELGLRPLAVHLDNGWNSELAVFNIKALLDRTGIDLVTHVINWEEFRDLQLSFLKASVANCEIPTDHAIFASLFRAARRFEVRFILTGSNLATESIMPSAWGHYNQDLRHLKALHRRFGSVPLETLPTLSLVDYVHFVVLRRIRQVPFLNFVTYDKAAAKERLARDFGWRDYGGKHYESVWTRFFQGYYLPQKFGFDKRKAHLSSMICFGSISREEALGELGKPIYDADLLKQDLRFVLKKFGLSSEAFDQIMRLPPKPATFYPSHHFLFHRMKTGKEIFRRFATTP